MSTYRTCITNVARRIVSPENRVLLEQGAQGALSTWTAADVLSIAFGRRYDDVLGDIVDAGLKVRPPDR